MAVRADGRIMASGGWDGRWEEPKIVCIESLYTKCQEGRGGVVMVEKSPVPLL